MQKFVPAGLMYPASVPRYMPVPAPDTLNSVMAVRSARTRTKIGDVGKVPEANAVRDHRSCAAFSYA